MHLQRFFDGTKANFVLAVMKTNDPSAWVMDPQGTAEVTMNYDVVQEYIGVYAGDPAQYIFTYAQGGDSALGIIGMMIYPEGQQPC